MSEFSVKFKVAEKIREKGDPRAAQQLFVSLLSEASAKESLPDIMSVTLQLGLCYEHLGNYSKALVLYQDVLKKATTAGNLTFQVLAHRHMVSVYVETGLDSQALSQSHTMMALLKKLDYRPENGSWILHGHIKALTQNGSPRDIVAKLALWEAKELGYAFNLGVESYKCWTWTIGWLSDMAYGYAPLGWILYFPAYLISVFAGLPLRQKQFRKGLGKRRI